MLSKRILLKSIFSAFTSLFLINTGMLNSEIKNNQNLNNEISIKIAQTTQDGIKSEYILDTGDLINIIFVGLETFSSQYLIDSDGFLNLPELKKVYVRGFTLNELEDQLITLYEPYIFQPEFEVSLLQNRSIKIFLSGEVKDAGYYQFINRPIPSLPLSDPSIILSEQNIPTLFDAIKAAKGVTNNADISNINVFRDNSISQGGGKIKAKINLLKMIQTGDQSDNIYLRDGDSIIVNKNEKTIKDQILAINKTNLNPSSIKVFVTGNVPKPGSNSIKKGTSLVQAISSSGGKKLLTGKIEFLRFKQDGKNDRRVFKYNPMAKINTSENPILMDGDIINVRKSILGNTTEILNELSSPVLSFYGIFNIFD